jgi:hypothetical protein
MNAQLPWRLARLATQASTTSETLEPTLSPPGSRIPTKGLPEKSGMGSGYAFRSFVDVTPRLAESNIPLPATFPRSTIVMARNDPDGIFRRLLQQLT